MSTYTENYNLIKPDETDYYDVQDFNENMDTLDSVMTEIESEIHDVNKKLGEPPTEADTLFSLLSSGNNSVIKSIQRVTADVSSKNITQTLPINPIDVSRSFALIELTSKHMHEYVVNYTLNSDSIEVTTASSYDYALALGFWIIEFN